MMSPYISPDFQDPNMGLTQPNQTEAELAEPKSNAKMIIRKLNRNSEPQASIEAGKYTLQCAFPLQSCAMISLVVQSKLFANFIQSSYLLQDSICFLTICESSYPRKLAFTYLSDLAHEFTTTHNSTQYLSSSCRPYAFMEFDTFMQRTKKTYQDSRASQNLDKLNDELRDVTKVMTKNIEDLLYRGDSLERMGEMSGRLREDSKKYRRAAVRINWELLLKQYGPFAGVGLLIIILIWWRFF